MSSDCSDFGLRGPKTSWACPSDRQLALRAKLQAGWSVKTNSFNTYPKQQPLTDKEQQTIVTVVKRAEEIEFHEQQRVGKLVDRLESLRRLASGNGESECILCADSFGISFFGRSSYRCADCKKAVCRKCVVDLTTTSSTSPTTKNGGAGSSGSRCGTSSATGNAKESIIRLCKLCSENREFIKKSGAWFYKGVPTYILPEKKNNLHYRSHGHLPPTQTNYQEQRYISRYISETSVSNLATDDNKRSGGVFWSRSLSQRSQSEADFDSSSDDEISHKTKTKTNNVSGTSASVNNLSVSSSILKNSKSPSPLKRFASSDIRPGRPQSENHEEALYELLPPPPPPTSTSTSKGLPEDSYSNYETSNNISSTAKLPHKSFDRFMPAAPSSESSLSSPAPPSSLSHLNDNNHLQLRSSDSSLEGGGASSTSSSFNQTISQPIEHKSPYGTIDISLLYDDVNQALHCSVHKGKDIIPTDMRNNLSDPYCMLNLVPARFEGTHIRTKTVHKSLQPIFNETLTFYGMTQNDLVRQSLQINVMDEDKWGRDCLGTTQLSLHRLKPQQTRFFTLDLEGPSANNGEMVTVDKEWGRGRLLLSLSYSTEKNALLVGVLRAQNLPALDTNGTSDPYVKVRLVHDSNAGGITSSTNCSSLNRKYKTSVKWKTLNPEFLEEFSLKVSIIDLSKLALAVSVWDKDMGRNNDYIGGVFLSSTSKGERLKHWTDVIKIPNKKHLKWHTLSPAQVPSS